MGAAEPLGLSGCRGWGSGGGLHSPAGRPRAVRGFWGEGGVREGAEGAGMVLGGRGGGCGSWWWGLLGMQLFGVES